MRGIGITQDTIKEIREYVNAGETAPEIARAMGLSLNTIYRHGEFNGRRPSKIPQGVVEKMKELQKKGLSHAEIAKETRTSWATVQKYLGQQKTGCKADYGSLSAKAQDIENAPVLGETKQGGEEDFVLEERIVSLAGSMFNYKVSTRGRIKMTHKDGMNVLMNVNEFNALLKEFNKIKTWLDMNCIVRPNSQDEWRK